MPVITTKPLSLPTYRLLLVEDNRGDRDLMREQLSEIHDFDLTIDDAGTLQAAHGDGRATSTTTRSSST